MLGIPKPHGGGLVPGPLVSWMPFSQISSFISGLRSWVRMVPTYSSPKSHLCPALSTTFVLYVVSQESILLLPQPSWLWGTMSASFRLLCAETPPPYLLHHLPHHDAERDRMNLGAFPGSRRSSPSSGDQGTGPLSWKQVPKCTLILFSYGYCGWKDGNIVLNWEHFLLKPLFCSEAFKILALATQNTFSFKTVISIIPKIYFNTQAQRIPYLFFRSHVSSLPRTRPCGCEESRKRQRKMTGGGSGSACVCVHGRAHEHPRLPS